MMTSRSDFLFDGHGSQQFRVLVVEDTVIVADEIVRMVQRLGYEVVGPIGALEPAMEFARGLASNLDSSSEGPRIDIALLDVNLNGKHVFPLAEMLDERGVPIVFLTGYARDSIPAEFRDQPCLEKPFGADELRRTLEGIRGHAAQRP